MTPREWVGAMKREYESGWPAFAYEKQGRVLTVLEAAVAWRELREFGSLLGEEGEVEGALIAAVAALPGEDAP